MSIYNEPEEWLRESIDSILNQTFSDFEFIIINDNPERQLNNILLKKYEKRDNRIVIINNEENIGLTKSLNQGLEIAKGEFIARMDGDDISLPKRFEKQIEIMTSYPNVIVCGTQIKHFGNSINKKKTNFPELHDENLQLLILNSCFAHPTVFIRKSTLIKYQLKYDESYKQTQDYKLWVDLVGYGQFYNLQEVLLLYRCSSHQITYLKRDIQLKNAMNCRSNCLKKLIDIPSLLNEISSNQINLNTLKLLKKHKIKYSNIYVLLWWSLNKYSRETFFYFIYSLDWRYFNFVQILVLAKRFLKSPKPLI